MSDKHHLPTIEPERWPADKPCPARSDALPCQHDYGEQCRTFVCSTCGETVPDCVGSGEDDVCDSCWIEQIEVDDEEGTETT